MYVDVDAKHTLVSFNKPWCGRKNISKHSDWVKQWYVGISINNVHGMVLVQGRS